jgi:hypothetical protein
VGGASRRMVVLEHAYLCRRLLPARTAESIEVPFALEARGERLEQLCGDRPPSPARRTALRDSRGDRIDRCVHEAFDDGWEGKSEDAVVGSQYGGCDALVGSR